ncbi:MAG TPA: DNA primase [Gammaproteobacteria bacterium]|nr:DNA primase [Gammaproteobacteria bacterium]
MIEQNKSYLDAKKQPSLLHLIESSGVILTQENTAWVGACPFHDDVAGRSLLIDPGKQHWQCDGECQTGGNAIDWVKKIKNVSRAHAAELLKAQAMVNLVEPPSIQAHTRTTVRQLDAPFSADDDDNAVLLRVVDYYHETLKQSPEALDYLLKRGITNSEVIEVFRLGFSNRTLGYRLPHKNRKEGALLRGRLQRLGVIRPNGHEHFRGSITVPIINSGVVEQIYARKIASKLRPGVPLHCYLPEPGQGVFNLEAVTNSDEVILCQSVLDALTFWNAGIRNVTCCFGFKGFGDEHMSCFMQYGIKRALIAFAATKEGDVEAKCVADLLQGVGIEGYRIEFSAGCDANSHALRHEPAGQSLEKVVRKAILLNTSVKTSLHPQQEKTQAPTIEQEGNSVVSKAEKDDGSYCQSSDEVGSDKAVLSESEIEAPIPATVVPRVPNEIDAEIKDNEIILTLDNRRYRVRGLDKNLCYDQLKINILVSQGALLHVDTFDLYASRPRNAFIKLASLELGVDDEVIKKDLGRILLKLEVLQDDSIQKQLIPKAKTVSISKKATAEALALLQSPDLVDQILTGYQQCGLIGEDTNKLIGYLAALSRKLDQPLAVMIQSTSAAGKSALMDAVLSFIPEEERVQYSAMTGQSLFYMGDTDLKHKILAISEEEGASNAAYALKLLQSEGQLTIASTGKDPDSGRHVTHEYKVQGPVMIFSTTTAIDIDEELLNRCLILTVNEDRKQTRAIHDLQRFEDTLEGLQAAQSREGILQLHQNAQRLLKPLKVVNPYARQLTFIDDKTRTRRDHKKYLTLIRTIALLHQYQREHRTTYCNGQSVDYIEASLDDIETANRLTHEVLGRSLDELPPQTQRLLNLIDGMVKEHCKLFHCSRREYQFTRRDVREYIGWGDTQLKVHLKRLEVMEYLLIIRGGRGQRIVYELLYSSEGKDGQPFMLGLIDITSLKRQQCGEKSSAVSVALSPARRHEVGDLSCGSRGCEATDYSCENKGIESIDLSGTHFSHSGAQNKQNHTVVSCTGGE